MALTVATTDQQNPVNIANARSIPNAIEKIRCMASFMNEIKRCKDLFLKKEMSLKYKDAISQIGSGRFCNKISRTGIIPFFEEDGELNFILPIGTKYDQVGDFGGKPETGERWDLAAIREYDEETYSAIEGKYPFPEIFEEDLISRNPAVIVLGNSVLILYPYTSEEMSFEKLKGMENELMIKFDILFQKYKREKIRQGRTVPEMEIYPETKGIQTYSLDRLVKIVSELAPPDYFYSLVWSMLKLKLTSCVN